MNRRPSEGLTSEWASALLENELYNIILGYQHVPVTLLEEAEEIEVLLFAPENQHQSMSIPSPRGYSPVGAKREQFSPGMVECVLEPLRSGLSVTALTEDVPDSQVSISPSIESPSIPFERTDCLLERPSVAGGIDQQSLLA